MRHFLLASLALASPLLPALLLGQCPEEPTWLQGQGVPGTDARIRAATQWDPDGPTGPLAAQLVVVGDFFTAGDEISPGVTRWDGTSWHRIGPTTISPFNGGTVSAVTVYQGDLIVGGSFTSVGGIPAGGIARWDGSAWNPIGIGINPGGSIFTLTTLSNPTGEELFAGGTFFSMNGVPAKSVARFDGLTWLPAASGTDGTVRRLLVHNGTIHAGGWFATIGGISAHNVARWDGAAWSAVGTRDFRNNFDGMIEHNGELVIAARYFGPTGDHFGTIERFDGAAWHTVITRPVTIFSALGSYGGSLYVGGTFLDIASIAASRIARFDGATWHALGTPIDPIGLDGTPWTLQTWNGGLFAGGEFSNAGILGIKNIARYDGVSWHACGSGTNGTVRSLATLPTGSAAAGGEFTVIEGVPAWCAAMLSPTGTSPMGQGLNATVNALSVVNGNLTAGGWFTASGATAMPHVARWNGAAWLPMGDGINGVVNAIAPLDPLDLMGTSLVAFGNFSLAGGVSTTGGAKWDGSVWFSSPTDIQGTLVSVCTLHQGSLVAGGGFLSAGNAPVQRIARWNGTQWTPLMDGFNGQVYALASINDDLFAGGLFTMSGALPTAGIAAWNGTVWRALGSGVDGAVFAIAPHEGAIVAGGAFTAAGGVAARNIARFDGTQWLALGAGVNAPVLTLTSADGQLIVGGSFTTAGGTVSAFIARWGYPPGCAPCDGIDFNIDGVSPDAEDITEFLSVYAGGGCSGAACNDIDFNNDGVSPDLADIDAFLRVFAGGACR